MRKVNKMLMATVSILLCLVLISTSVVSGIYAKFVITKSGDATVSLKAFGITLEVKCGEENSGGTITPTTIGDNTVSVTVDNVKMIPREKAIDYNELIVFELDGTPNVPKVKLKITVDFSGVSNFNIPANTVLDSNYTITTGGNYLPFAFCASTNGTNINNVLNYWRNPTSDDLLEVSFVNAVKAKDTDFSDNDTTDNSIEAIIWDSSNTESLSVDYLSFGYAVYKTGNYKEGVHPKNASEADAMQTYFANKTPAPTFSATYTVSIEQVID